MAKAKLTPSPVQYHLDELEKSLFALDEILAALTKMAEESQENRMAYSLRCVLFQQSISVEALVKLMKGVKTDAIH